LSGFDQGMLLGATALSTLAVSLPTGALADRFGARGLTLAAGWIMVVAMVLEAFAPSFAALMFARLVFGAGYGIVWTAGLAWLASASPDGSGLGGTVASSGFGGVVGPLLAGVLAQWFGLAVPFLVAAGVFLALTVALTKVRATAAAPVARGTEGFLSSLSGLAGNRCIVASTAAVIVAGVTWSVAYLLAPEELHAGGVSAGSIGLILSAAAVVYVIGSTATAAFGNRAVRAKVVFAGMLALALSLCRWL
jgi:DHA1 family multidrug resistance protein-like MFS transporter